ncbi:unnamed protein product [Adineta steineri]|uniref:F-box domain-containing protein n=1 Tax=Adineta steineri TaxID=433720 RepID=A0A814F1T3_9BILA|nr:unnamed protein product [Adineta steineri]
MSHHQACFELLPNEILIEFFQYFDAQELFHAFYKLNIRLNALIQSFHHLKLVFYLNKMNNNNIINNNDIFRLFIYTLRVDSGINVNLTQFPNIRHLKLEWPSNQELQQLCSNVLPYLEKLNLVYIGNILTNTFLSSKFSYLDIFPANNGLMCLPSLRILKIRFINLSIYQTILSLCPNLYYFQLSIFTSEEFLSNIPIHDNLKRLVIRVGDVIWPWNDNLFNKYLSCVPNLEQLNIHRLFYISRITESFFNYDWFASIISTHLRTLYRFHFYLRCFPPKYLTEYDTEKILNQIKNNFIESHHDQYQSRLIIQHS